MDEGKNTNESQTPNEEEAPVYEFKGSGLTAKERRWAKKRFDEYKEHYHIDHLSDLQLLEDLVFREALQERFKKQIEKIEKTKANKENVIVPKNIIESLDGNLEQIIIIKERLGLFEEKGNDPYKHIQTLKKKFKMWLQENQGSRTIVCPHCSKMIMLKIRTDAWEALKHPFFKDRILSNEHLWQLYKEGKITKLDVVKVLLGKQCQSADYADWLEEKIYPKDSENPS